MGCTGLPTRQRCDEAVRPDERVVDLVAAHQPDAGVPAVAFAATATSGGGAAATTGRGGDRDSDAAASPVGPVAQPMTPRAGSGGSADVLSPATRSAEDAEAQHGGGSSSSSSSTTRQPNVLESFRQPLLAWTARSRRVGGSSLSGAGGGGSTTTAGESDASDASFTPQAKRRRVVHSKSSTKRSANEAQNKDGKVYIKDLAADGVDMTGAAEDFHTKRVRCAPCNIIVALHRSKIAEHFKSTSHKKNKDQWLAQNKRDVTIAEVRTQWW